MIRLKKPDGFSTGSSIYSILFSNELFYAHFSMYGVIHKNVPITFGSSFKYLASSVIPRAIYDNRPTDIYQYYSNAVNASKGQIHTIHHATGCYLNFGLAGLIFGAFILGMLFVIASFLQFYTLGNNRLFFLLLQFLMPFLICGQLVTFITAGPEAYKSMILEGILIPVLLFSTKGLVLTECA